MISCLFQAPIDSLKDALHTRAPVRSAGLNAVLLLGTLLLTACAHQSPGNMAARHNWDLRYQTGEQFRHLLVHNRNPGRILHVYLEGDGRAFVNTRRVAIDPTPARPLMLELMTLDADPALYLGRPCYFGTRDHACRLEGEPEWGPVWWTSRRYDEAVVSSLNAALDSIASDYDGITLFGHSGGATLAMLMAARRQDVLAIVTLAGNLDTRAWSVHHGYGALTGSLNPMNDAPLKRSIRQLHYLGEDDTNITAEMLRPALERQAGSELNLVPGIAHNCCWRSLWPDILKQLDQ